MHSRTSNRGRSLLVFLIVLAVIVATLYYRGGAGLIGNSQRVIINIIAPAQRGVAAATDPFRKVARYTIRLSRVTSENHRLMAQNAVLRKERNRLRRYRSENKRLRELAGFRAESQWRTAAALIISRSPTSWQSVATIDIGSEDGAKKRASILTDKGLVGQIVEVGSGTALVQLVDDRRSGVAVEVARTGATGIVEGRMNGSLRLRFVSSYEDIKKGDELVTSGVGQVHPRGIPVGMIGEISETAYSLEKQIRVTPAVDYRRLSELLVIIDRQGVARDE